MSNPTIAIIGAGLTGLSIAKQLQDSQATLTLFDKSRGVSGRVATRRAEVAGHTLRFDHGTPSLTECQAEKISSLTMPTQLALEPWLPPSAMTGNEPHFSLASGMNGIGKNRRMTKCKRPSRCGGSASRTTGTSATPRP